jgi:hypothetical protein
MDIKTVIMFVAIALLLMIVISYILRPHSSLTTVTDGKTMQTVKSEDLDGSDSGSTTSNFTYAIWFYIDDWNYRYGEPKLLFARSGKDTGGNNDDAGSSSSNNDSTSGFNTDSTSGSNTDSTPSSFNNSSTGEEEDSNLGGGPPEPCPAVLFGAMENSMVIKLTCYDGTSASEVGVIHNCNVPNIPLQKWTQLLISVYGRALDVYIDGKLVKTCMLPGVPKVSSTLPVIITPAGGFSGWTAAFEYWNDSTNPQDAWNAYKKGYGENMLKSIMSKYSIKISVMEGDTESNSMTL